MDPLLQKGPWTNTNSLEPLPIYHTTRKSRYACLGREKFEKIVNFKKLLEEARKSNPSSESSCSTPSSSRSWTIGHPWHHQAKLCLPQKLTVLKSPKGAHLALLPIAITLASPAVSTTATVASITTAVTSVQKAATAAKGKDLPKYKAWRHM